MNANEQEIINQVKQYYGQILKSTKDLKTSACCTAGRHPLHLRQALSNVPEEVLSKYYGCGNPIPTGISGLTVLDLGCGSGRDCYVAAQWVGKDRGRVIGVDMTEEQLIVARGNVEKLKERTESKVGQLEFKTGLIEFLETSAGVVKESVDIVISNCVVNLSPRKDLVLQSVYNVLRGGGEFHFSDVYCDRRLPDHVRKHSLLWGECIAGAMYTEDFKDLARQVGFKDPRILSKREISVNEEFKSVIGEAKFFSITFRLFKLDDLEVRCEDYGQVGVYNGGIDGHSSSYILDYGHRFEVGKPMLICGNTASIISESWIGKYFTVHGNRKVHYGLFECGEKSAMSTINCC